MNTLLSALALVALMVVVMIAVARVVEALSHQRTTRKQRELQARHEALTNARRAEAVMTERIEWWTTVARQRKDRMVMEAAEEALMNERMAVHPATRALRVGPNPFTR